jgi:hypothetical protein
MHTTFSIIKTEQSHTNYTYKSKLVGNARIQAQIHTIMIPNMKYLFMHHYKSTHMRPSKTLVKN